MRILTRKRLPKAFRTVSSTYDYGIVKFRRRDEAYCAKGQLVEFQVVQVRTINSQVRVHLFLEGEDKKSRKLETIDVDLYLSIPEFRKASGLLRGMLFRKDKLGTLIPKRWKRRGCATPGR
jgi:hypothetical protein